MANLAQLEELFWRAVRSDRPVLELEAELVGSVELSAARRMGIYRSAYWMRQERVLMDTFPVVRALVGDARFRRLAAAYLNQHPSERPAIEWIGHRFPDALASHADLPGFVHDVARLEWARLEVLLASPSVALGLDALRGLDFAAARAQLCPSVRVLHLCKVALQAWRDHTTLTTVGGEERIGCLVWRHGHQASHRALDPTEHAALELLRGGHDFARVCTVFSGPGDAEAAARCIGRWIRDGLLCAIDAGQGTR
jgi:hypothetical protein